MIDTEAIAAWLGAKRWFAAKGRQIAGVRVLDHTAVDGGDLVLALIAVSLGDGGSQIYSVPLIDAGDGPADAFEDPGTLAVLGGLMAHGATLHGSAGTWHFSGAGLDPLAPPGGGSIRVLGAEQSNSSVVLDDEVFIKFFRKVAPGINPDVELVRALTSDGFEHIPVHVGEISYTGVWDGAEVGIDLAIAQRFLAGASDGWSYVLETLVGDQAGADDHVLMERIESLGDVTAGLHVMLAREELEPALAPEPVDTSDIKGWVEQARSLLDNLLSRGVDGLDTMKNAIDARLDRVTGIDAAGWKIRVHGDYHLGQVMHEQRGWMILDFEGEPARSLEERRTKTSALKDVAGMLRSFSYAVATASEGRDPVDLETWEGLARERFLAGYLRSAYEGHFLPPERADLDLLLDLFEIDKALYEIGYELDNRPDWVSIPLRGIEKLLARGDDR